MKRLQSGMEHWLSVHQGGTPGQGRTPGLTGTLWSCLVQPLPSDKPPLGVSPARGQPPAVGSLCDLFRGLGVNCSYTASGDLRARHP